MYMRITGGRVKAGCWEEYERVHRTYVERLAPAKGLVGRWLIRATNDPDLGYSVSLWETLADMEAYERSDAVKREILPHVAPHVSGQLVAHHCEVRFADVCASLPAGSGRSATP